MADWNEAIAADPTYGAYRVELCRYVWTAALLGRWGPREEPLQLEAKDDKWAVGTCQKMVKEASSPEDQLLLLSEMAFQYHGSNHNSEILRLFTDANRIIDSAIAQGKGTLGMLDPINRIANERSKVQRDLSRQRRPTGLGRLSHEERIAALDRHREEVRLAGIAVYQVAERQIDAILTQQGPAQHESRAWSGLAALARRVRRDDEAMAVKLLERARQSAGAALVVNPIDQAAHWWLANVLGALRLHVSRNESISLGLIEIDHWRSLVKLDSVRRDYLGGLASALASAASKMENSADRTRRIAFEQEGLALRIELARNVDPQKQLATTQELAETYSSLATSHGLARQWALAIENGVRGLELAKVAFELAEKDPLERAIRGGEPPDAPFEELRKLADFLLETGDRDRAIRIAEDWLSFLTARQPRVGNATPQSDDIDEVKELLDDLSIAVRVTPTS